MEQPKPANEKFIYEVAVSGPLELEAEYLKWLTPHLADMLKTGYFNRVTVFDGVDLTNSKLNTFHVVMHYYHESQEQLEEYLKHLAPKMRSQLPADWVPKLSYQRKKLKITDRF